MFNPTTIEIGDNDSIAITKNGKVIGFVKVKNFFNNRVELVGYPVNFHNWDYAQDKHTFNSFACSGEITVDTPEDVDSMQNFTKALNA